MTVVRKKHKKRATSIVIPVTSNLQKQHDALNDLFGKVFFRAAATTSSLRKQHEALRDLFGKVFFRGCTNMRWQRGREVTYLLGHGATVTMPRDGLVSETELREIEASGLQVIEARKLLERTRVKPAAMTDDETFLAALEEVRKIHSDLEISTALGVSLSTVNRWTQGKSLPHPVYRKPILTWIKNNAKA